jgi:hypothetical protein
MNTFFLGVLGVFSSTIMMLILWRIGIRNALDNYFEESVMYYLKCCSSMYRLRFIERLYAYHTELGGKPGDRNRG